MPTYEYKCKDEVCDHRWELTQKITDEKITICPICEQETAERLISGGVGFSLKGGGWAKDNYSSSK